jgi:metallo-beta-lactamase family protein
MAEAGRILHHLRNNMDDERNTIMIVSWQAPYTRGRRLAEQEKYIKIFGEKFYRRAEVATIGGLSAHAGQDFLQQYARSAGQGLEKLFLVHGEKRAAKALMAKFDGDLRAKTMFPWEEQVIEI